MTTEAASLPSPDCPEGARNSDPAPRRGHKVWFGALNALVFALVVGPAFLTSGAAVAHCWPQSPVPCAERPPPPPVVELFVNGAAELAADWTPYQTGVALSGDNLVISDAPVSGEHFLDRKISLDPDKTIDVRAVIGPADRTRVRIQLTGGGPASAFCDFDLDASRVSAKRAQLGASLRKNSITPLDDDRYEIVCQVQLAPGQTETTVRLQLLDDTASGVYMGEPGRGIAVYRVSVSMF